MVDVSALKFNRRMSCVGFFRLSARLIRRLFLARCAKSRRIMRLSDMPPSIVRDVCPVYERHRQGSFEENWQRELEHLRSRP